jgi:hypothetical protein
MVDKSRKPRCIAAGWITLVLLVLPCAASAQNQQPAGINLGGTSFFDGFGKDGGGFTLIEYLQWATSSRINGKEPVPGTEQTSEQASMRSPYFHDPQFDIFVLLNQIIYTLPDTIFGEAAYVGINFLFPLILFNTSFGEKTGDVAGAASQLEDNGFGIGDLTFGPMLQFRPIIVDNRPLFSNRIEIDFVVPTGDYDPHKDLNQSSNFVSLNPYWAATLLPTRFIEISLRVNFLYNFKNYHPALNYRNELGQRVELESANKIKYAQAGQAGWLNFAASLGLFPHIIRVNTDLNIGVSGYYFHQFNLDLWELYDLQTKTFYSTPGYELHDTGKAKIFGLGPGIYWKAGEHDKLFANLYFQLIAENKAQSTVTQLRWVHGF